MRNVLGLFLIGRGVPLLVLYVLTSLFLSRLNDSAKNNFFVWTTSTVLFPAQKVIDYLTHWSDLDKENTRLLQDNAHLKIQYDENSYNSAQLAKQYVLGIEHFFQIALVFSCISDLTNKRICNCLQHKFDSSTKITF